MDWASDVPSTPRHNSAGQSTEHFVGHRRTLHRQSSHARGEMERVKRSHAMDTMTRKGNRRTKARKRH